MHPVKSKSRISFIQKLSSFGGIRGGFILKSFVHYLKANMLVALGVAISTMVLTGSLIIGDSVRHSLTQATFYRLGETTHLVSVRERYFRQEMADELEADNHQIKAAPILLLEGMAVSDGGQRRANKVQIVGVNTSFEKIAGTPFFSTLQNNQIAISENLAMRLQKKEGDNILVRIKKASLIPMNAPFVSAEETSVSLRASIKKVVSKEEMGRFNLKNSQTAPYNLFVNIDRLNQLMEFKGKANRILIASQLNVNKITQSVNHCLTPADAGLVRRNIEKTGEIEIASERVFLDEIVAGTLMKLPGAKPVLTYFVNEIEKIDDTSPVTSDRRTKNFISKPNHLSSSNTTNIHRTAIPYSFVSTIQSPQLTSNEILLNRWAANDLGVKPGDSISLKYFKIGPLRKLIEKKTSFVLKEIFPMDSELADPTLTPHLPGLSDAGHCREWEAGVPIDLDAILEKDEKYWNDYKGTPKAFISIDKASVLWSNRFGIYTAVRYPASLFSNKMYNNTFRAEIQARDLGMHVEPIRKQGVQAAQNGTDFSGLFIGMSFFILAAAIILTALLFRFNVENRAAQLGLLDALGISPGRVRTLFLWEGLLVAFLGGLTGLMASVFYTRLVFRVLNSLWFDIVRTNVLEIKILPETLVTGLIISVLVSISAIFIAIRRFQKYRAAELQKHIHIKDSRRKRLIYNGIIWISLGFSIGSLINGIFIGTMEPSVFFMSGGMLLLGLLLLFRRMLYRLRERRGEMQLGRMAQLNLSRNIGRSLTIVILFALGTFLVVSTGSNKLDLFANAADKSSGTGGFLYFAETTMPVLFDINSEKKRAEEGIQQEFRAIQFRRVDGDDASCLNLNRIAQPAVLGVDPEALQGRFSFAVKNKDIAGDPWLELNTQMPDGTIPAIADQTVIQWGLGKKVGDVLKYQNEQGDTLRLKLIAGTSPSIFQGFVIISNKFFLQNYPTSSGSNLFLIEGKSANAKAIGEELQSVFRDYGWEMENTANRLVQFYSVTNTYLSIFLALGALGLILGTIGLAVILARTLLERRREIALMQAVGFDEKTVFKMLAREYMALLFVGVLIGFVAALVATLPAFLSTNTGVSFSTVVMVVGIILLNGLIWIFALSWFSLKNKNITANLRIE